MVELDTCIVEVFSLEDIADAPDIESMFVVGTMPTAGGSPPPDCTWICGNAPPGCGNTLAVGSKPGGADIVQNPSLLKTV